MFICICIWIKYSYTFVLFLYRCDFFRNFQVCKLYESSSIAILLDILTSAHIVSMGCLWTARTHFTLSLINQVNFFSSMVLRERSQIKEEFMFSLKNFVFLLSLSCTVLVPWLVTSVFWSKFTTIWKYNLNKKCTWSISTRGRLKVTAQRRHHLSLVFLKTLPWGRWSGLGLNPGPPARQTITLPTGLTGRR